MMSLLALSGFGSSEIEGLEFDEDQQGFDDLPSNLQNDLVAVPDLESDADLLTSMGQAEPLETLDFSRGELIEGFDPSRDILELEYTVSLGTPDIIVSELPDGDGVSVAMNGFVVAQLDGAFGLNAQNVVLVPV